MKTKIKLQFKDETRPNALRPSHFTRAAYPLAGLIRVAVDMENVPDTFHEQGYCEPVGWSIHYTQDKASARMIDFGPGGEEAATEALNEWIGTFKTITELDGELFKSADASLADIAAAIDEIKKARPSHEQGQNNA